jgi:hypothetical protein
VVPGAATSQLELVRDLTDRLAEAMASPSMSHLDREKLVPALRGLLTMEQLEVARRRAARDRA